jgi:diadenylate cyclase
MPEDRLDKLFGNVCESAHARAERRRTLEEVIQLAVELAREGREGRKIGTLFVVGDPERVLALSRPLLLDPLYGHPRDVRHIARPDFRETVKELAQLDGAFVVEDDGTFISAGRFVDVDLTDPDNFLPGLGARHAAAASISRETTAIAVVVSQSSIVRVFGQGEVRAEIIPELFLLTQRQLFARDATVEEHVEEGVTVAVAGDDV